MSVELYNKDGHICVAFRDLVTGDAVQANQFLIVDEAVPVKNLFQISPLWTGRCITAQRMETRRHGARAAVKPGAPCGQHRWPRASGRSGLDCPAAATDH